jgi:hypothetical protein
MLWMGELGSKLINELGRPDSLEIVFHLNRYETNLNSCYCPGSCLLGLSAPSNKPEALLKT